MNVIQKFVSKLVELRTPNLLLEWSQNHSFLQEFLLGMQRLFNSIDLGKISLTCPVNRLDNPVRIVQYANKVGYLILEGLLDLQTRGPSYNLYSTRQMDVEHISFIKSKLNFSPEFLSFLLQMWELTITQLDTILETFGDALFEDNVFCM
jgi:hypothetical protein